MQQMGDGAHRHPTLLQAGRQRVVAARSAVQIVEKGAAIAPASVEVDVGARQWTEVFDSVTHD